MKLLGLSGLVFFLACWGASRLCRRTSKLFLLDHPNARSLHAVPTPRTGGVAIFGSLFLGVIVARVLGLLVMREGLSWWGWVHLESWILGMTILLGLVSFLDDHRGLPVLMRFGLQLLAACGVVFGGQVFFRVVTIPGLGAIDLGWAAVPITIAFLLWMTNLYNFMDGMDGLAGGMTVMGFGLMAYLAWTGHHPLLFGIAALQAAATAGFLVHNFPPAKIFMGDVGSISTGFLAGALVVLGCRDGLFDLWVPILIFSPFIVDATVTLIRRAFRCEKIWNAHREHYYQRLVLSGWSHRQAVLAEYAVMACCGMLAILYQGAAEGWRLIILGTWAVLFLGLARLVDRIQRGAREEVMG